MEIHGSRGVPLNPLSSWRCLALRARWWMPTVRALVPRRRWPLATGEGHAKPMKCRRNYSMGALENISGCTMRALENISVVTNLSLHCPCVTSATLTSDCPEVQLGPLFLSAPTSKLSFEAPNTTFFDRLDIFSDAINVKITPVPFVSVHG